MNLGYALLITAALVAVVMLSSCALIPFPEDVPQFESPAAVYDWIYGTPPRDGDPAIPGYITYLEEPPGSNFWQYPEETLEWRTGDCEDLALLWMSIVIDQFNGSATMQIWEFPEEGTRHAHPCLDGVPMGELNPPHTVIKEYDYAEISRKIKFNRN